MKIIRRWIGWVRRKFTLKIAWYLYTLSLTVFVLLSIKYPDPFISELGILIFSIAIMYLIMITSNIEIQRGTEKQVKAFVEQLQAVGSELKSVGSELKGLIDIMIGIQRILQESLSVSKTVIALEETQRKRHKELIKPQLYLKVEQRGFHGFFDLIDLRRYHLTIANSGGDCIDTWVYVSQQGAMKDYGPYEIKSNKQIDIDLGHVNEYKGLQTVEVQMSIRDIERNPYYSKSQLNLNQTQWVLLALSENP